MQHSVNNNNLDNTRIIVQNFIFDTKPFDLDLGNGKLIIAEEASGSAESTDEIFTRVTAWNNFVKGYEVLDVSRIHCRNDIINQYPDYDKFILIWGWRSGPRMMEQLKIATFDPLTPIEKDNIKNGSDIYRMPTESFTFHNYKRIEINGEPHIRIETDTGCNHYGKMTEFEKMSQFVTSIRLIAVNITNAINHIVRRGSWESFDTWDEYMEYCSRPNVTNVNKIPWTPKN